MPSLLRGTGVSLLSAGLGPHDILTITDNGGGAARVTTAGAHGLAGAESVVVSGSSVGDYNTTHTGVVVVSDTVFDTEVSYSGDATGGSWVLA